MGPEFTELKGLVQREGLHTVCEAAGCPNIYECWEDREATFLIGGDQCTRRCDFCQIDTGKPASSTATSRGASPSPCAPWACATRRSPVSRATTSRRRRLAVRRDRAPDPRAQRRHRRRAARADFNADPDQLAEVFSSGPRCSRTTSRRCPRIFRRIRPGFRYDRSLDVLRRARDVGLVTKSNLILGMGETTDEAVEALRDLHAAGCELVTITQYLRPSPRHHPVERWVKPEEFVALNEEAEAIGFAGVMSGPLVRSSYRAGRLYEQALASRGPDGAQD
jgi:lipoic acid synthetase